MTGCGRKLGPYDCCTVVCGDCLELMKALPDGSVDAVITDPPYLDGPTSHYLAQLLRLSGNVIVTPGAIHAPSWIAEKRPAWIYCWLSSANSRGGSACMNIGWEPILTYEMPYVPLGTDALSYPISRQIGVGDHPWPKPLRLFEKLMYHFSREGEFVLDPFLGSGTTAVAAKKLGRHFLGFEISPEYCKIAEERIALVEMQPQLFKPKPEQLSMARL